ncbi:MAG: phage portal protein [Ignavibacteriales bacterium]|nr:MAG: phage portal protein [Ignavibacteriales bacterium]
MKANALIRQLQKFIKSFFLAYAEYLGIEFDTSNLEIVFNKSLIFNESERITDMQNSREIVSKKTQFANHPWVKDVDGELK